MIELVDYHDLGNMKMQVGWGVLYNCECCLFSVRCKASVTLGMIMLMTLTDNIVAMLLKKQNASYLHLYIYISNTNLNACFIRDFLLSN